MIVRIVRMTFQEESVAAFLEIFNESKNKIRSFPGCLYLELLRDVENPHVMSTYSHWDSETDLNAYRQSAVFGDVWPKTKLLFGDKPVAHSYESLEKLN